MTPQAILALPDPTEWEREATGNAHYHQTLEFAPVPTSSHSATRGSAGFTPGPARGSRLSGKSIFCGVSAARQQAQSVERSGGRSRGRAGQVTVLSFEPTLSLTNLLAARADVRLSCRALAEGKSWLMWLRVCRSCYMYNICSAMNVDEESRRFSRHVSRRFFLDTCVFRGVPRPAEPVAGRAGIVCCYRPKNDRGRRLLRFLPPLSVLPCLRHVPTFAPARSQAQRREICFQYYATKCVFFV